jgi:colicin import membrane protein
VQAERDAALMALRDTRLEADDAAGAARADAERLEAALCDAEAARDAAREEAAAAADTCKAAAAERAVAVAERDAVRAAAAASVRAADEVLARSAAREAALADALAAAHREMRRLAGPDWVPGVARSASEAALSTGEGSDGEGAAQDAARARAPGEALKARAR